MPVSRKQLVQVLRDHLVLHAQALVGRPGYVADIQRAANLIDLKDPRGAVALANIFAANNYGLATHLHDELVDAHAHSPFRPK